MNVWSNAVKAMLVVGSLWAGTAHAVATVWMQQATDWPMSGLRVTLGYELIGDPEDHLAAHVVNHAGLTGGEKTSLHGGASLSFQNGNLVLQQYNYSNWNCDPDFGYCYVFITKNNPNVSDTNRIFITVRYNKLAPGGAVAQVRQDTIQTHWRIDNQRLIVRYDPSRVGENNWQQGADGIYRPKAGAPKMLYEYTW